MKNKLLLLITGLSMITQLISAQVPYYVPSNGLVGYWPFNGNANDASGNNLNGTVTGATLTANRFGIANGAYLFNPNTVSKISIQTQAVTGTGLQNNFSILMWVKPNRNINMLGQSTSCPGTAAINLVNQNQNWALAPAESGTNLGTGISIGNNGVIVGEHGTNILVNRVSSAFNKTGFVCVVLTYSNNTVNVYVDGVLANTVSNYCVNAIKGLPSLLELGTTLYSPNFSGVIDDLGVWNRALSQQEITSINSGVYYSDTCNAVSGSITNGLVGYWPFCGNANDDSGNGNNGTVNGATLTTDRFGNLNSAYSFDGVNDFIDINDDASLRPSKISISVWYKTTNPDPFRCLVSKTNYTDATNEQYFFDLNDVGIKINSSCNPNQGWSYFRPNNAQMLVQNSWNHLVFVWDGVSHKVYKNGQILVGVNWGGSAGLTGFIDNCTGGKLQFGRWWQTDPKWFDGLIDDIGIWNRALTQQEITQLYNQNQCVTNITVTDTLIINVGQLSYTNPVAYANSITIFPNPANTQVNISFNNITDLTGGNINIVNSLGQQVATTPITLSGTNTTMPLNTWGGTGLYFVQILNAQGIVVDVKKIILQ
jgi:hypothetical protein